MLERLKGRGFKSLADVEIRFLRSLTPGCLGCRSSGNDVPVFNR